MALQYPKGKFISIVKVGDKGQIVIPKGARELFGIQPGDQLWIPGAFISITILAFYLFGNSLRDALDPHLRD